MTEQSIAVEPQVAVDMQPSGCKARNPTTKQIMAQKMKIKRAAITQVRRFFYGPTLKPTLKNQALHFCSFGTLVQLEALERVRTGD